LIVLIVCVFLDWSDAPPQYTCGKFIYININDHTANYYFYKSMNFKV
jgi:hypothetical protein